MTSMVLLELFQSDGTVHELPDVKNILVSATAGAGFRRKAEVKASAIITPSSNFGFFILDSFLLQKLTGLIPLTNAEITAPDSQNPRPIFITVFIIPSAPV
ncbi:MAG: hypothetical protein NTZ78_14740 [Candidatus Aureabacteria bacterium]|nr:hypothetical protein [Candidatus Auribacterota bacterium]